MNDINVKVKDLAGHDMTMDKGGHAGHGISMNREEHEGHSAHVDHSGHEQMFRKKFWISLVLSIPVLIFSQSVQSWLGYSVPEFPGSNWIIPVFAVNVFLYGELPFLKMAVPEIKNRKPGMMTLISLAISVAFVYSVAALFLPTSVSFF
jgi:Cu2+-exporting ATPase